MTENVATYRCPNCGAALSYNAEKGNFACLFCDSTFAEADLQAQLDKADVTTDEDAASAAPDEFVENAALYTCPSCGAGIICGELETSVQCHFCHTPVVLAGKLTGEYKPSLILPFSTTSKEAEEMFAKHVKGKFLLPRGFKENAKLTKISALYVPYWLKSGVYDVGITADCTTVKHWRSGNTHYENTKYYDVFRHASITFVRVPCDGSRRIEDDLLRAIEPFDYKAVRPFSMAYLSGCAAERYDVPFEEAEKILNERIDEAITATLMKDLKAQYNSVNITQTNYMGEVAEAEQSKTAVYALLPVWFLNYQYKGKDYPFVMNGQTGSSFIKLPRSRLRSFLFGLATIGGSILIALTIGGAVLCFG